MNGNITIQGRVTGDSEMRYTPDGTAVCSFTMSVFTGKKDDKYLESWWVKVGLFGDEGAAFKKGEVVSVTGWAKPLKFWTDRNGQPKVDIPVTAKSIQRVVRGEEDF